jgi:NADH:ubiquinone oxidoreductase subunit 6 (subunit J)
MKLYIIFLFFIFTAMALQLKAQEEQVVPFTLADRDRIARTEMKIEALEANINVRFEAVNGKFESLNGRFEALESKMDTKFEVVFWILGVMMALILFILGYTIWDRRTALRPALEKASHADETSSKAITILRELAQKYPEIAEKLKMHGLL